MYIFIPESKNKELLGTEDRQLSEIRHQQDSKDDIMFSGLYINPDNKDSQLDFCQ